MLLTEAIELHDKLNPELWNEDKTLKEDVYEALYNIYIEFVSNLDVSLNIVDVEIVGSNASYNYNEQSDIDLHIIVNSEVNWLDSEILQQFYNSKKGSFNDNYNVSVNGIPVELYIEDVKSGNVTNGRYSILEKQWILEPKPIEYKIPDISKELQQELDKSSELLNGTDAEEIRQYMNSLYMMRKLGLAEGGEASVGNLVFKELRNMNILKDLKSRYYELRSKDLSL